MVVEGLKKKALLGSSEVRMDTINANKDAIVATEPSPLLLQLLEKGYEVHVVTGRTGLTGALDGCWVGLVKTVHFVPLGRNLVSIEDRERWSQWSIKEAQEVLRDLDIPWDRDRLWNGWGDHRGLAAQAGWFVGWHSQYKGRGLVDVPTRKYQMPPPVQAEEDIQF